MSSKKLIVSIIVPARNATDVLGGCLQSLCEQSMPKGTYEIIIVDDASTDGTADLARSFGATVVELGACLGSYSARNRGVEIAGGPIVAFTDADCIADRQWLAEGLQVFDDPTVGCVVGVIEGLRPGLTWVERQQLERETLSEQESLNHSFLPYAQTANAFYRQSVWSELGGFAERWISGGDADLSWRMQKQTAFRVAASRKAVVRHRHRRTVGSMCRQAYRHGIGHAALWRRYRPELKGLSLTASAWGAIRSGAGIVVRAARPGAIPTRREAAGRCCLDLAQIVSRSAGFVTGSLLPSKTMTSSAP